MCGFAGYLGYAENARGLLAGMTAAIAHRGPDDRAFHVEKDAGLGHARLAIIDPGNGRQPMSDASGGLTVAFSGEIFNYVELRDDLIARGRAFRTATDTEVILHLYETMGERCVEALNGDFAFALWDRRRRRMLLARDRMGVRPLFHAVHGGTLYFASEAKALLRVPGIEAALDPVALDQIFTLWAPIAPRTVFKGIDELEPACLMLAEPGGKTAIRAYWRLQFPDRDAPAARTSEAETAEELRGLLHEATRIRLRADVPVGAYLSGGLDSSITAALASGMAPRGLKTFSVTFDSAEHDESAFQEEMAQALQTDHSTVECGAGDIADAFPEVIRFTERPVVRTAPAPLYRLSKLTRDRGLKVVLTGEGADEAFAGYDLFKEAKVRRFCARQPDSTIRPRLFRRLYPYLPGLARQPVESLAAYFAVTGEPQTDPLFSHRPRLRGAGAAKRFFSDGLRAELAGYDAAEELVSRLPEAFGRWHPLHQAQYLESRFLLPGYILSSQGDRMAMAHGVEGRFPFLDHRLVEFAAALPPRMKLKGLTEKYILRKAVDGLLPPSIAARTKQPYRAPDIAAFMGGNEREYVGSLLDKDAIAAGGLFNPRAVAGLLGKCRRQPPAGFRDNAAFVGILSTALWQRTFAGANARAIEAA